MLGIRFVLLLILSMALEVAGPPGPDVMESLDESQEAACASAHPRLCLDRDIQAPSKSDPDRTTAVYQPPAVAGNQHNRPLTGAWVRKLPPAASDSASSPEDH